MRHVLHSSRVALATLFLLLTTAAQTSVPVAAAEIMALAESPQGAPLLLGDEPTTVTLAPAQGMQTRLRRPQAGERLYLVLQTLHVEQSLGTNFELYFDLPPGVAPTRDDPHYVADFTFFDAESGRRSLSFNITKVVAALAAKGTLGERPSVTIVPGGRVAASRPSIARIALVIR